MSVKKYHMPMDCLVLLAPFLAYEEKKFMLDS